MAYNFKFSNKFLKSLITRLFIIILVIKFNKNEISNEISNENCSYF